MIVRVLPLAAAALALAACGKTQGAAHAGAAADPQAAHAVVVRPDASLPSKKDIAALFDDWNDTLRSGGSADMALLYAEDAVLAPTDSNDVRSNRVEIARYFDELLSAHPRVTINEQHIDVLDSRTAINSGIYTIDLVKEAQPTFVVARYMFLYQKIGGKWLIRNQQSSLMPEAVLTRPPALAQLLASNDTPPPAAPVAELRPTQAEQPAHH